MTEYLDHQQAAELVAYIAPTTRELPHEKITSQRDHFQRACRERLAASPSDESDAEERAIIEFSAGERREESWAKVAQQCDDWQRRCAD